MNVIQQLREIGHFDGSKGWYSERDPKLETIEVLFSKGDLVHTEFEEGGRWSNFETKVRKFEVDGEVAYFQTVDEVPATESQEGMDCMFEFFEVTPYQVTVTKYSPKF